MTRRRQATVLAIIATSTACGHFLGADDEEQTVPPVAPVIADGGVDAPTTTTSSEGGSAPLDDGGCRPPFIATDSGARQLYGYASTHEKSFDGLLDDFSRDCPTYALDRTSAARTVEDDAGVGDASAIVYVEWESDTLWVGIDVSGTSPQAIDGGDTDPRIDDSFEIYVAGKPEQRDPHGLFTTADRQWIVDFLGNARQYAGPNTGSATVDTKAAAKANDAGYTIEVRVRNDVLPPLAKGTELAFDGLLNVGTGQTNYMFLGLEPHQLCLQLTCPSYCSCYLTAAEGDVPSADTYTFVPLTLR
jgi:hypothetical protein